MEGAERAHILRREAQKDEEESWTERRATSVFMEVLEEGETVLKALKRLGKKKKGSKGPDQTPDMKREFDELTEASDYLMRQGKADVYHTPKEQLVPQAHAKPPVLWEYKSQDGQIQGPYPTANFIAWQAQISTDRSSCLSWEDESEDDSCVDEGDDVEIHCEQDHYPLHRRQSDVAMFRASVLQAHACPLHLHQIFDSLQELHHRVYVDRCLVHVRPSFLLLDLVHAATSVELMKRTLLDVPLEVLDLLLDMIDDTWVDILGLQHYGKRGEVHYARL
ncbi:hypothetical protein DYB32_008231 [Aphanomyces invadans]|uniref:GYF domain-containing protein n=1 Tax=Aphanomyces invadans TaxID=157072 RepID=A0A3R6VSD1_9STRA|nr:hypothetical protein DYB32_008231 [Aphanomyces invadans]